MDTNKITGNPRAMLVLKIVGVVLVLGILYYYYRQLQTRFENEPYFIKGVKKATDGNIFSGEKRLKRVVGNEFTYSLWLKIDDWDLHFNKPKHLFHVGDREGNNVCPGVWLYPKNNNLLIRINTHDRLNNISKTISGKSCQAWSSQVPHKHDFKPEKYSHKGLGDHDFCRDPNNQYKGKGSWCYTTDANTRWEKCSDNAYTDAPSMNPLKNPDMLQEEQQCDLVNIPVQRWNHIGIVLINRTLDVYLNGKLARSCTFHNVPIMNDGDLYVNQDGGFRGEISDLLYANRGYSAGEMYKLYTEGHNSNSLLNMLRSIIPSKSDKSKCASGKNEGTKTTEAPEATTTTASPRQVESVTTTATPSTPRYLLHRANKLKCPTGYESVSQNECYSIGKSLLPSGKRFGRGLQVGNWSWVPAGCSLQSRGDWAPHYGTGAGANMSRLDKNSGYRKVCKKAGHPAFKAATSCINGRNFDCEYEGQYCPNSASKRGNYCCVNKTWTPLSNSACAAHRNAQKYE